MIQAEENIKQQIKQTVQELQKTMINLVISKHMYVIDSFNRHIFVIVNIKGLSSAIRQIVSRG